MSKTAVSGLVLGVALGLFGGFYVAEAEVLVEQTDGSIVSGTYTGCNNNCSNVAVASQVFSPTVSGYVLSIKIFTGNFRTSSLNPSTNTCRLKLIDQNTNSILAVSSNNLAGYSCAGSPEFLFSPTPILIQNGALYRWEFYWETQNFTRLDFYGSGSNVVGGTFSPGPVVNSKFTISRFYPPPTVSSLSQNEDTDVVITENGITAQKNIKFKATLNSLISNSLEFQVELRQIGESFTGLDDGGILKSGFNSSGSFEIQRNDLADAGYHWRFRAVDADSHFSAWQEFGSSGNIDFTVSTQEKIFSQENDSANSILGHYSDNWYQLGNLYSGEINSISLKGYKASISSQSQIYLDEFNDQNYSILNQTYVLSNDAPFTGVTSEITFGDLNITLRPNKFYRLRTNQSPGGGVSLKGLNGVGTAMYTAFVYGVGKVERTYSFTPYIVARDKNQEPVIIVPGILGSRLNRISDGEEVWPNVEKMRSLSNNGDEYLDQLKLSQNGSGAGIYTENILESEKILSYEIIFYKNLLQKFNSENLFIVPYDWRLDLGSEVEKLESKIEEARQKSSTGKVNIIAHSMGGLLVKQYLSETDASSYIDKIIFAGVPNLGSPKAFKALNYGDNFGFELGPLDILNPQKVKEIGQNMPGVYELLPSEKYVSTQGSYIKDYRDGTKLLNYLETDNLMLASSTDSRNPLLLNSRKTFHDNLDNRQIEGIDVYNLVGCKNPDTIGEIGIYENGSIDIVPGNGDGTVPLGSAMNLANNFKNYFVSYSETGINHLGLVKDERTLGVIDNIIQNKPIVLSNGISTSTAICFNPSGTKFLRFSTHSPVKLHVYDQLGNHVGLNADGDIDLQISGSSYETLGENSFVFVPDGIYRIEVKATDTGEFTLKVKELDGSSLEKSIVYPAVPIEDPNLKAELDFLNFENPPELKIDSDGDSEIDKNINGNLLDEEASLDVAPPTVDILKPNDFIVGAPETINVLAEDDISGLDSFFIYLDEVEIANGYSLENISKGTHIIKVRAIDKAGNIRNEKKEFTVFYDYSGLLSPFTPGEVLIVKKGRTLPLKFKLTNYLSNYISNASATVSVSKISNSVVGDDEALLYKATADSGNQFRYDPINNQYVFNLNTSSLTSGTWQIKIDLDDGKSYTQNIVIK